MSTCCEDPTEPRKIDPRELLREQERYGSLVRDLFTGDPEKTCIKLLHESNNYLRELAALRAHYPNVRLHAIELLDKNSLSILEQIGNDEASSQFGIAARKQIENINKKDTELLSKLFHN